MGVTLKEIAALAGVHRSTVDKVLHKRPGVSDEVRRRVQAVIDETGYRPNPVGRALQKQSAVIRLAAILLEVDARPFMERGIRKAVDALHMYNIQVDYHACTYGDVETQLEQIECATRGQVDGIILSPLSADSVREAVNRAVAAGIPVVCTNTDIEGTGRLCYVGEDAAKASRIAGRIMGEFLGGAGEIAVITSTSAMRTGTYFLKVRETGFQGYMAENFPGIHIVESVPSLENPAMTYQMTLELLRRQPELRGVYVVGGGVREVGRAIRETGCGGRLKVVCFEDYPEILELLQENIVTCTINSDTVRQGELPVRILIDYLMQDERPAENVYIPGQILVRECL